MVEKRNNHKYCALTFNGVGTIVVEFSVWVRSFYSNIAIIFPARLSIAYLFDEIIFKWQMSKFNFGSIFNFFLSFSQMQKKNVKQIIIGVKFLFILRNWADESIKWSEANKKTPLYSESIIWIFGHWIDGEQF